MPRKSGKPKSREGHEGARTLKFVDVTRQYSDGYHDAEEEKSIRAYVMREFLWHKSEPEKPSAPAAMKDSMQDHVIRFRYAKRNVLRHNTAPAPSHHRKIAMSRQSELGNSAHDPYQNESLEQGDEAAAILRPTPSAESADVDLSPTHSLLSDVLGDTGCRDPFARLPVDTSTETQRMLHYYHTTYWTNSLANNPTGSFLHFAATDPALFHATLSIVSQHEAFMRREPPSRAFYFHRGEAIRILTTRIGDPVEAVSDATIGAVAVLSVTDNEVSAPSRVQWSHRNGLASLVEMRGGLDSLSSNEAVSRTVIWADLLHAASHSSRPMKTAQKWKVEDNELNQLLASGNMSYASATAPGSDDQALPVPTSLIPAFGMLRLLCISRESPDIFDIGHVSKRKAFSTLLSRVERVLMDDYATALAELSKTNSDEDELTFEIRVATVAGSLIFSYWGLRDMPVSAQPYKHFTQRLRSNLQKILRNPSSTPNVPLALLLWLLFQGFKATRIDSRESDRTWFVSQASNICKAFGIDEEDDLELTIRELVYLKESDGLYASSFWRAIQDQQQDEDGSDLAWLKRNAGA